MPLTHSSSLSRAGCLKHSSKLVGQSLFSEGCHCTSLCCLQLLQPRAGLHLPTIESFLQVINTLLMGHRALDKFIICLQLVREMEEHDFPPARLVVDVREGFDSSAPLTRLLEIQGVLEVEPIPPDCVWQPGAPYVI